MSLEDKLQKATGAAKELAGKVTGDKSLESEGAVEKVQEKLKKSLTTLKKALKVQLKELKTTLTNNRANK